MYFLSMAHTVMDIATKNRQIMQHLCPNKLLHTVCFRENEFESTLINKYHENRSNFETMLTSFTESKLKHFCMSKMWHKLITVRQDSRKLVWRLFVICIDLFVYKGAITQF